MADPRTRLTAWRNILLMQAMVPGRAGELPLWWNNLIRKPALHCEFVQESESAVFGKLRREGQLAVAPGGRVRVAYRKGLLLVSDGRTLIQHDPAMRTAQRMDLRAAAREMPLLNILVDPAALGATYDARSTATDKMELVPRRKDLSRVEMEGSGGSLQTLVWTDATGARQVLRLTPSRKDVVDFTFKAPAGTRWLEGAPPR